MGQGEDIGHPGADPLEVFGALDGPDEAEAADGGRAGRVGGDEGADVREVVGDADAGGEEEEGAVGG